MKKDAEHAKKVIEKVQNASKEKQEDVPAAKVDAKLVK